MKQNAFGKLASKNFRTVLFSVVISLALMINQTAVTLAASATPICEGSACHSPFPPTAENETTLKPSTNAPESVDTPLNLPQLKAVLVVGPIDGDTGSWTQKEISNAELAAAELEKYGVQVSRFYTPNNSWEEIKTASNGAHFFMYRGHGLQWKESPEEVGGFALKGSYIKSNQIASDLKLAPGAIAMIYACYSAGTTSTDEAPGISQETAYDRVAQYSAPFVALGVSGYYADWYGQAFQVFIQDLFTGMSLGDAYKNFDYDEATLAQLSHPDDAENALWLDSHFFGGATQYNHAFVGKPEMTLVDLFAADMQVGPEEIAFTTPTTATPQQFNVLISNTKEDAAFQWTASIDANEPWAQLSNTSGNSGESLAIALNPQGLEVGTYTTEGPEF